MTGHWSDCAIYNAPALPTGPCDCGGLELALDVTHGPVPALIAGSRSDGLLPCHEGPTSFVQSQQFPPNRFMTDAAAGNLPDTHDGVVFFGGANGMHLDIASVAVISKLKDLP
jgi:hypothetical protein